MRECQISAGTSTILYGGDIGDALISTLLGGAISYGIYQTQMSLNYAKYKSDGGKLTRNQFNTISRSMQRSFSRGKEYGGWIMDDGTIDMRYDGQTRENVNLGFEKPKGATANFHTHPNLGNWQPSHSKMDLSLNTVMWKTTSWVFGRQNIYSHFYSFNTAVLQYSNRLFNPYPFNSYYFSR